MERHIYKESFTISPQPCSQHNDKSKNKTFSSPKNYCLDVPIPYVDKRISHLSVTKQHRLEPGTAPTEFLSFKSDDIKDTFIMTLTSTKAN